MLAQILCAQRIMIIDGAMGTTIQQYKLQVAMHALYAMRVFLRMLSHKRPPNACEIPENAYTATY